MWTMRLYDAPNEGRAGEKGPKVPAAVEAWRRPITRGFLSEIPGATRTGSLDERGMVLLGYEIGNRLS